MLKYKSGYLYSGYFYFLSFPKFPKLFYKAETTNKITLPNTEKTLKGNVSKCYSKTYGEKSILGRCIMEFFSFFSFPDFL